MISSISKVSRKSFPFKPQPHHIPILFPKSRWEDRGDFWLSLAEQGTDDWLDDRKGRLPVNFLNDESDHDESFHISDIIKLSPQARFVNGRVTGSSYGAAAGHSPFTNPPFVPSNDLALEIAGLSEKIFSDEAVKNMKHGSEQEQNARIWYENKYDVKVEEVGLAVPKWNFHLGSSVDGIVEGMNGIIEIKCPARGVYQPLKDYVKLVESGWKPSKPLYHDHIYTSHYDQMQGGMAILQKDWCDYIVYSTSDSQVYCERILFNKKYWDECLYPKLEEWLDDKLFPILENILKE